MYQETNFKIHISNKKKVFLELSILMIFLFSSYIISLFNYLLFHSITELFSIVIAEIIFVVMWNSRNNIKNSFFMIFGISSFFLGVIDLIHTLSYKNMGVFPDYDANLPTQLWIAARYIQALSIFFAITFTKKDFSSYKLFILYLVVSSFLIISIFARIFPDCYIEGSGLTDFKIYSEYVITLILLVSVLILFKLRSEFSRRMLLFITLSIVSTMISELAFTFYVSVYGFSNFTGHIFKIIEFYLIYKAIIQSGLKTPLNSLFLKLKRSEESYKEAYDRARLYKDIFSHDIGNIIQNISLSVEFSKTSKNKSNMEYDMLNIIEDQIFRAKNLIKNVQKLSEIEKTTPPLKSIKIIEKLRESVNFIRNSFPETDLKIDIDPNFDDLTVLANELIVDVFENILVNSINYNENPHKEISIKAFELEENSKKYIKLEFEDNGIGIEDSRKTIIFHRGHHGEKGSKGMGLGLSLVKKIITLYNGQIWIEDRVRGDSSKGSNFVILLQKAIN